MREVRLSRSGRDLVMFMGDVPITHDHRRSLAVDIGWPADSNAGSLDGVDRAVVMRSRQGSDTMDRWARRSRIAL